MLANLHLNTIGLCLFFYAARSLASCEDFEIWKIDASISEGTHDSLTHQNRKIFIDHTFTEQGRLRKWSELKSDEHETRLKALLDEQQKLLPDKASGRHVDFHFRTSANEGIDFILTPQESVYIFKKIHYHLFARYLLQETLGERIRANGIDEDDALLNALTQEVKNLESLVVDLNIRFMCKSVREIIRANSKHQEALDQARLTLQKSIRAFDFRKGYAFTTYFRKALRHLWRDMGANKELTTINASDLNAGSRLREDRGDFFDSIAADDDTGHHFTDVTEQSTAILALARSSLAPDAYLIFTEFYGLGEDQHSYTKAELAARHHKSIMTIERTVKRALRMLKTAVTAGLSVEERKRLSPHLGASDVSSEAYWDEAKLDQVAWMLFEFSFPLTFDFLDQAQGTIADQLIQETLDDPRASVAMFTQALRQRKLSMNELKRRNGIPRDQIFQFFGDAEANLWALYKSIRLLIVHKVGIAKGNIFSYRPDPQMAAQLNAMHNLHDSPISMDGARIWTLAFALGLKWQDATNSARSAKPIDVLVAEQRRKVQGHFITKLTPPEHLLMNAIQNIQRDHSTKLSATEIHQALVPELKKHFLVDDVEAYLLRNF